jgi:iron complex outermembrane receptor protein
VASSVHSASGRAARGGLKRVLFETTAPVFCGVSLALLAGAAAAATPPAEYLLASTAEVSGAGSAGGEADAGSENAVAEVVVTAGASRAEAAQRVVEDVPGGASIIDSAVAERGRVQTNADLLAFQPGLFAQSANGGDALKMSIRGSGANVSAGYFRSGIYLLFDGLPLTGPGGSPYEFFEPLGLSYTQVLRGANAFDIGSLSLGGAINYVSKSGRELNSPLAVRLEGGSFGYEKFQLASGQALGPLDYYVSVTGGRREGYQTLSKANNIGVMANVGYEISPQVDTRFYLRYRQTSNQTPGSLTRAQIEQDPRQANPTSLAVNAYRYQPGSWWLANRTTFHIDDNRNLQVGLVYDNYPIDANGSNNRQIWGFSDFSASIDYNQRSRWFDHDVALTAGLVSTTHLTGWQDSVVRLQTGNYVNEPIGEVVRHATYGGTENNLHLSLDTALTDKLNLTVAGAVSYIQRSTQVTTSGAILNGVQTFPGPQPKTDYGSWDFIPRVGLRYAVTPDIQVYGNISKSVEPPTSWGILNGDLFLPATTKTLINPLAALQRLGMVVKNQRAITYEIGSRGRSWIGVWDISLYHAEVKDELLNVLIHDVLPDGTPALTSNYNATPTVHNGVELGLTSPLWRNDQHSFTLIQALTVTDLKYKNDPLYGHNKLPGIPPVLYQASLGYQHTSGFYLNGTMQAASSTYVDQANTFSTKPYQIYGLTVGYARPNGKWETYLDFRNLLDKHYAASVSTTTNDHGTDQPRSQPGDGFGVFAGVSAKY